MAYKYPIINVKVYKYDELDSQHIYNTQWHVVH
jgi:hypothetical protein